MQKFYLLPGMGLLFILCNLEYSVCRKEQSNSPTGGPYEVINQAV